MFTSFALPLLNHQIFHTHDVDEARECVARIFCPHELRPKEASGTFDARHHSVGLHQSVSLNYVQYGSGVVIEPGYLKDFYLLQMPMRGGAQIQCGGQTIVAHSMMASLPSPTERLKMSWGVDSPHRIVRLAQSTVTQTAEQLMQRKLQDPLVFDLGLPLGTPELAPVVNYIHYLYSVMEDKLTPMHRSLMVQAESYLINALLLLAPHNYSQAMTQTNTRQLLPGVVKRGQEYMQAHVTQPLALADICHHLGVSARSLQQAFHDHAGMSPMDYLRAIRLDAIRTALQSAAPQSKITVSSVAADFGVLHVGHLAQHYKKRFGEYPAQTLARARII